MGPSTIYTMFRDLNDGDFVFVSVHDHVFVLVWMGKTQGDVVKGEHNEFFKMVKVQWWVPMIKGANLDE